MSKHIPISDIVPGSLIVNSREYRKRETWCLNAIIIGVKKVEKCDDVGKYDVFDIDICLPTLEMERIEIVSRDLYSIEFISHT